MANKPKKVEKTKKSKNKGDVAHASPEVRRVRVDEIVVKGDFRELDKKTVSSVAESIKEVGLMNPPTVFIKPSKDESGTEAVHLVAGNHRLEAAIQVSHPLIHTSSTDCLWLILLSLSDIKLVNIEVALWSYLMAVQFESY
jgi:hypothetical protein